jgi:hypothetical protein
MIVQAEIEIRAPLPAVWTVFSQMERWREWNTVCNGCGYVEGDRMAPGACIAFTVKPMIFPVRVAPRIVRCEPQREVVWEGGRFGIRAVHTWRFHEIPERTRLESVEEFRGALLRAARLFNLPGRMHELTTRLLEQIKRQAESCAAPPPFRNRPVDRP